MGDFPSDRMITLVCGCDTLLTPPAQKHNYPARCYISSSASMSASACRASSEALASGTPASEWRSAREDQRPETRR